MLFKYILKSSTTNFIMTSEGQGMVNMKDDFFNVLNERNSKCSGLIPCQGTLWL